MAYQVLARKYRPQRFSDVAGQDHVTRTLLNALSLGRIAHGYIFSGHRGIGKTTIARILASALNCRTAIGTPERPTPEPCGICESCTEIRAGNAVDVIEIDAATNRGIDEIRELRDAARYRPARDKYKIYILDEAHQITDAAFNALLKTLEEPPDHVVFMMATTQPEDFPQTIRSRCQHFSFHAVKFDDILAELRGIAEKEGIAAEDAALALLAEAGDGSMRDALSIMDQAIASAPLVPIISDEDKEKFNFLLKLGEEEKAYSSLDAAKASAQYHQARLDTDQIRELMGSVPNAVFERLMEAIGEGQSAAVIDEINRLLNAGNSASQLARQFVKYLRNVLMARIAGQDSELLQISPDERARAGRSALLFSEEDLTRFLQIMLRTFDELNYRQEQRFHLELGLIKLVHLQRLLPIEDLLSKLPPTQSGKTGGGSSSSAARPAPVATSTTRAPEPRRISEPRSTPEPIPEPTKPAFSPFEADRSRKITGESNTVSIAAASAITPIAPPTPAAVAETAPPRPLTPLETASRAVEPSSVKVPVASVVETAPEVINGSLALAADAEPADSPDMDLDRLRNTVCSALENEGHNTASVLLSSGQWRAKGDGIEVEVGIKKTMLGLTMNPEAEKIVKNALRSLGATTKISFVPGEASASGPRPTSTPVAGGSVQAAALENPLVQKAQELFQAEVRSVLDLRERK